MAVIASGVTSNGVRYRICDDCMLTPGTDEWKAAVEHQRRVAHDILKGWAEHDADQTEDGRRA